MDFITYKTRMRKKNKKHGVTPQQWRSTYKCHKCCLFHVSKALLQLNDFQNIWQQSIHFYQTLKMTTYDLILFVWQKKLVKFSQLPYSSFFNQTWRVYPVNKVTRDKSSFFVLLKPVKCSNEPLQYLFHKQCRTPSIPTRGKPLFQLSYEINWLVSGFIIQPHKVEYK